jgi:cation transporter-like permease
VTPQRRRELRRGSVSAKLRAAQWEAGMKAFVASIVALVVISVAAGIVLSRYDKTAETAYTTTGARPK